MRFLLLAVVLLCLTTNALAQSHRITRTNPHGESEFPGGRGAEELIVYTPEFSQQRTGTNMWGTEATIRRGIVEQVGENDSLIPEDGIVVSGHGAAARWISTHLSPGTPVTHTEQEVRIDTSAPARLAALKWRVKRLDSQAQEIAALLAEAEGNPTQETLAALEAAITAAYEQQWLAEISSMPSPEGEVRAVWTRLRTKTREGIAQLAEEMAAAGVNVVFPETIFASQSIFPDSTALYTSFPEFAEVDGLKILIEECHPRGIEVHAWVHCFFIGIEGSTDEPPLLAERYPEWLAKDRRGSQLSLDETNYMFLNPAIAEVRSAKIAVYTALARNYQIDGFQFDYIRYGQARDWMHSWDFSDYTRDRVKAELGFDPMEITPEAHPEEWKQWLDWREEIITSFVREAATKLREINPDILITADVFPELEKTIEVKAQNWAAWGTEGYVDALLPMAYTTSAGDVAEAVRELEKHLPPNSPQVAGLGPYLNLTREQLIAQIAAARAAGANGQCLFNWESVTEEMRRDLAAGPWRERTAPRWK